MNLIFVYACVIMSHAAELIEKPCTSLLLNSILTTLGLAYSHDNLKILWFLIINVLDIFFKCSILALVYTLVM